VAAQQQASTENVQRSAGRLARGKCVASTPTGERVRHGHNRAVERRRAKRQRRRETAACRHRMERKERRQTNRSVRGKGEMRQEREKAET